MKLNSPTIYVLHKVSGVWAKSAFSFTGKVDRRRIKREIIKAFRQGGEVVHAAYIDASIDASLKAAQRVDLEPVTPVQGSIYEAEEAALEDTFREGQGIDASSQTH